MWGHPDTAKPETVGAARKPGPSLNGDHAFCPHTEAWIHRAGLLADSKGFPRVSQEPPSLQIFSTSPLQALLTAAVGLLPVSENPSPRAGLLAIATEGTREEGPELQRVPFTPRAEWPLVALNRPRTGGLPGPSHLHRALRATRLSKQGPAGFSSRKIKKTCPQSGSLGELEPRWFMGKPVLSRDGA